MRLRSGFISIVVSMTAIFVPVIAGLIFVKTALANPLNASQGPRSLGTQNRVLGNIYTQTITPCSYWSYSGDLGGYACRNVGFALEVPEANSLDNYIRKLESKIQELENRVRILETNGQ
jgi:hypothetical protein